MHRTWKAGSTRAGGTTMTPPGADRLPAIARWTVWTLVVFNVLMMVLSIIASPIAAPYSGQYGWGVPDFLFPLALVVQVGFAALIALRQPRHPVGWLLLVSATAFLLDSGLVSNFVIYAIDIRHRAIPGGDLVGTFEQELWVLGVVPIMIFLPLVFPTGKLLSRRWRPVLWIGGAATIGTFVGTSLAPNPDRTNVIKGVHPVLLAPPFSAIVDVLNNAILLLPVLVLVSIIALTLRYRRGSADERHQIQWLLLAIAVYALGVCASILPAASRPPIPLLQDVAVLGIVLVPLAAAIAVLKYRLYDIDVVISRTLVYGSLAAFLTALYA